MDDPKQLQEKNNIAARKDREAYIFLSLFLLVLSFFIVLVAVSSINKQRATLVFKQLSKVLEESQGLRILRQSVEALAGKRQTEVETLKAVNAEWSAQIPLINQSLDSEKKVLEIDFPYYEIINRFDSASLRIDREELLLRTANLLNVYGTQSLRIYTSITYIGPPIASKNSQSINPEVAALGAIARRLEEEAIPSFALTIKRIIDTNAEPFIRFNITFGSRFPKEIILPLAVSAGPAMDFSYSVAVGSPEDSTRNTRE